MRYLNSLIQLFIDYFDVTIYEDVDDEDEEDILLCRQ